MIRDGHVMQWFADGNVAVIGHGNQKVNLSDSQENEKKQLSHTIIKRDGFISRNNGGQELGNSDSCEWNFQCGETPEEEIHGGLEVDIQQGQGDNGQVPSDAEHVGDEQKDKDQNLKLWVVRQSQEDKFSYLCIVSHFTSFN